MAEEAARWLDWEAVAAYVSVRVNYVSRLVKAGKLPPLVLPGAEAPRWNRLALDATMAGGVASLDPEEAAEALVQEMLAKGRGR